MATHSVSDLTHEAFTRDELIVLGLFHAGVRARALRDRYRLDPWEVVNRHRQLPRAEFARVRALADRVAADDDGRFA